MRLSSDVPPNDDGTHHGLFVARILATHGIDVSRVVVTDVLTGTPTSVFYPLAMHVTASTIAVPGPAIGVALNATWLAIATVSLPFGMYLLARRTFPTARRAAVAVAMVSVLTPQLLVTPTFWGGIALIAGMSIESSGRWKLAMRFSTAPRAWYAPTWRVAKEPLSRTRSTS